MLSCFECLKKIDAKKTGIFAAGVLFGTAGIKILASDDAKKFYTNCTAALHPSRRMRRIFTRRRSRSMKNGQKKLPKQSTLMKKAIWKR